MNDGIHNFTLPFGYGMGPTFGDFDMASLFTKQSLYFSSQWIYTTQLYNDTPIYPDKNRLKTYLKNGVIPVIVVDWNYRFNGHQADTSYYYNLTDHLNNSGPIIVAPYAGFDPENHQSIITYKEYANIIRNKCPNCLIALAPDINLNPKNTSFRNITNMNEIYASIDDISIDFNKSKILSEFGSLAKSQANAFSTGVSSLL